MFRVFTCLTAEHDWRLVMLAGLVCFAASIVAVSIFHRATASRAWTRLIWIAIAGAALFTVAGRRGRIRLRSRLVAGAYLLVAVLHALWDAAGLAASWLTLHLTGSAGLTDRVRDLAARETECCSFFKFTTTGQSAADGESVVLDIEVPGPAYRLVVLADLVRLGAVRIEVVLAMEPARLGDSAVERQADLDRLFDDCLVDHRQHAGMAQAERAGERVRLGPEPVLAGAEHLGGGIQLDVDLQPDHRLVAHPPTR